MNPVLLARALRLSDRVRVPPGRIRPARPPAAAARTGRLLAWRRV
ncbi:hypothetical protein [Streptomyces sp. NPDC013455]